MSLTQERERLQAECLQALRASVNARGGAFDGSFTVSELRLAADYARRIFDISKQIRRST